MWTNNAAAESVAHHLAPLGRRKFLLGLGAASSLVAAGGLQGCSTPPEQGLQFLTEGQAALFRVLSAVVLPGADSGLLPHTQLPMVERIDAFYGHFPHDVKELLTTAMQMFEWGPWVIGWHLSRFSELDTAAAIEYCERWQAGNTVQRGIFAGLRQVALVPYWTSTETWSAIGYEGPTSRKANLPMLGVTPYPGDVP